MATNMNRGVVVVAEDDEMQRELLQELLEGEGYQVLVAQDAEELLLRLDEEPDLVLLDLVGVASPEVLRVLTHARHRPALCLVSAARGTPQVAAQLHAEAFMTKPYELDRLLRKVATLTEERRHRTMRLVAAQL